jgi:hypothetical protein
MIPQLNWDALTPLSHPHFGDGGYGLTIISSASFMSGGRSWGLLARQLLPKPTTRLIIPIEKPGRPSVRETDLIGAAPRNGLVFD